MAKSDDLIKEAEKACEQVCKIIGTGIHLEEFNRLQILNTPYAEHFDWKKVFMAAATAGNVDILRAVDSKWSYADPQLLNDSLRHAILAGDNDHTAHYLIQMGANPMARDDNYKSIVETAIDLKRIASLEEMIIWGHDTEIDSHMRGMLNEDVAFRTVISLSQLKEEYKSLPQKELQSLYVAAVENKDLNPMMVAYAESRTPRLVKVFPPRLRDEFDIKAGKNFYPSDGMVIALAAGKYTFAQQMVRDGLKPLALSEKGKEMAATMSPMAQGVHENLENGVLDTQPIAKSGARSIIYNLQMNLGSPF